MKHTALHSEHIRLGAKMVEFSGWEMPVLYSSIIEEHNATRERAGIFDICHMGEFIVKGPNAASLLSGLIPTDINRLEPSKAMYSCLVNERGGTVDDLFIYMRDVDDFFLVVNASRKDTDLAWMRGHAPSSGVEIVDVSDETAKIDVQGPMSPDIMKAVFPDAGSEGLRRFYSLETTLDGETVMLSMTGYTGERGYELYMPVSASVSVWNRLLDAGKPFGLVPVGLGARDTLRLEAGYSLYGHELTEEISPVEAGLGWLVNSKDSHIGRDVLTSQKERGAPREIVCLRMRDRGVPRDGYPVARDGEEIGVITSGGFSPTFKVGIALALVKRGSVGVGERLSVMMRGRPRDAEIVPRPLYAYNG
ncbi:MAG: glycine cleavage system aminomethyltransferase GcvT [Deltaproteobacteria bacterium]|nr:glycine cleavage system aminomethyltransferase GcvT [Candidatus Zymogenaceae bacterium]